MEGPALWPSGWEASTEHGTSSHCGEAEPFTRLLKPPSPPDLSDHAMTQAGTRPAGRHTARRQRYGSAAASQKARPDLRCASLPSRFKTQKLLIRFTVNSAPLIAIVNYNVFILSFINKIVSVANKAEDYPNIRVHKTPQTLNQ